MTLFFLFNYIVRGVISHTKRINVYDSAKRHSFNQKH